MTPWHKVPSEQQGQLVMVTWHVLWGTLVQAAESLPCGKVWATWAAGPGRPLHRGRCHHTWQSQAVPSRGHGASTAAAASRTLLRSPKDQVGASPVVPALPRVQRQCHRDALVRVGTRGGSSCGAGISQRGFALLAHPSVAQERCESPTAPASHLSLPAKGALLAHSRDFTVPLTSTHCTGVSTWT